MRITDIIFALVSGRIIGFLLGDFLRAWGINIGPYLTLVIWLIFPLVSVFFLWLFYLIGRRFLFVFQGAKFLLVGAVATVIDLKIFEFLSWVFSIYLLAKALSFIIATFLKYWGNKYWAFRKPEKENIYQEIIKFFLITFVGSIIDVLSFYYFTKVLESQFSLPTAIWVKLSVILAGIAAALWNFFGYKFLVFKK